ncbi:MAG: UbiD family decarboxylase [Candidatus Odinarchaeum yellowstonii]|uniref:Anhydromevalonate phosphate decarboxylase n=1 Tax=Odinarchaeota yellowstonii (strain LCB_4) TaxID=1841599 RepID=A0AAF0D3G5_ODILC|nr:MAG: UbiD family decarboxylase [Candidatus Odinarchaeum yellowstonii]
MIDLRAAIEKFKVLNMIKEINVELSPRFEIPAVMQKYDNGPILIFNRVKNHKIPIISGVAGSRKIFMDQLGCTDLTDFYNKLLSAISNPSKPELTPDGEFYDHSLNNDLYKLPILTFFEKDRAPYITSGIVYAKDPDSGIQNASIHRLMVVDKNHLAIRIVPRHLYSIYQKYRVKKQPLTIAIAIGVNPLVALSASAPVPFNFDEMYVANTLLNKQLKVCKTPNSEILVPSHSEIVIEASILPTDVDEGPFLDITGTYDEVRKQPLVEVNQIYCKPKPLYHGLLPAGAEHKLLMGLFREVKIYEHVKNVVPYVRGVNLTLGGTGWLHAVVSVSKQTDGDGKNVIFAAFSGHPSLKHVVVVDEDIDPYNMEEVEWAIATRLQGDKGLVIVSNARGSTLDPSGDQLTGLTTKIGVDATRPLSKPKEVFMKGVIPHNLNLDAI